jgi:uncharacterized protein DUF3997
MKLRRVLITGGALSVVGMACLPFVLRLYFHYFPFDILGAGHADFSAHLAGDYWLYRTSAYQIMIAPETGVDSSTPVVPTMVVECATDGRHILAKRHGMKRRSPSDPSDTYEEEDSSIEDFWILDSRNPKVYGPLTEPRFNELRASLLIPDTARLRDIDDYRPPTTKQ